jgi:hypothetical protein
MVRILMVCILLWSGTVQAYADDSQSCDPPYDPSNIIEVLFFYPGTLSYLAHAPDHCRTTFAVQVKKVVRETSLMTDGCIEATMKDLNEALAGTHKGEPIPAP